MADELSYDVCPETGIGCVMLSRDSGTVKIDLMPSEVADLRDLIVAGEMDKVRDLLAGVEPKAAEIGSDALEALARKVD